MSQLVRARPLPSTPAADVTLTPISGVAATTVQGAVAEHQTDIAGVPATIDAAVAAGRLERVGALYALTGYSTASVPAGDTVVGSPHANLAAFETAVPPTTNGARARVVGYPIARIVSEFQANGTDWVLVR